jgi:hypothetical protein
VAAILPHDHGFVWPDSVLFASVAQRQSVAAPNLAGELGADPADLHGLLGSRLRRHGPPSLRMSPERVTQRAGPSPVRHAVADQLLVCHPPDLARPAPPADPARAGVAAAFGVGLVHRQQQPPAVGKTVDLGSGQGKQGVRVSVAGNAVELVESTQHRVTHRRMYPRPPGPQLTRRSLVRPAAASSAIPSRRVCCAESTAAAPGGGTSRTRSSSTNIVSARSLPNGSWHRMDQRGSVIVETSAGESADRSG